MRALMSSRGEYADAVQSERAERESPDRQLRQCDQRHTNQLAHHQRKRFDRRKQDLGNARLFFFDNRAENDLTIHQDCQVHHETNAKHQRKAAARITFLARGANLYGLQTDGSEKLLPGLRVDLRFDQSLFATGAV